MYYVSAPAPASTGVLGPAPTLEAFPAPTPSIVSLLKFHLTVRPVRPDMDEFNGIHGLHPLLLVNCCY